MRDVPTSSYTPTHLLVTVFLLLFCMCHTEFNKALGYADTSAINKLIADAKVYGTSSPDSAIGLLQQALKESRQAKYNYGTSKALISIGLIEISKGNYDNAIEQLRQALPYCLNADSSHNLSSSAHNNIALAYLYKGDYQNANTEFLLAATIMKENFPPPQVPPSNLVLIYNNIGSIYMQLNQYPVALKYLDEGEQLARRHRYKDDRLSYILASKGNIYMDLKEYKKAVRFLSEGQSIAQQYGNNAVEIACLTNLGNVYLKKGNPHKGLEYLHSSLRLIGTKNKHGYGYISTSYSLGDAYLQLGQFEKARETIFQAIQLAEQSGTGEGLMDAYLKLAKVYEELKNPWDALAHQKTYIKLKDSLLGQEKAKAINDLEIKYSSAEKDKQIVQNKLKLSQQENILAEKNLWIGSISGGALLLTVLLVGLYRNDRHKQRLQEERIKSLQKEQEITQLIAMMKGEEKERTRIARELHDGIVGQLYSVKMNFNAVQTEHQLASSPDFIRVMQQLEDTASDLRKTAHNLMPEILLEGGIAEALQLYCQRINKNQGLEIEYHLYGTIPRMDQDFELSVYRIIQELCNNIIKHAKATRAIIQLNCQNDLLVVAVEDNGKGIERTSFNESRGMGLGSVSSRVKAFKGHIELDSQPGEGTTVHIEYDISGLKRKEEPCPLA